MADDKKEYEDKDQRQNKQPRHRRKECPNPDNREDKRTRVLCELADVQARVDNEPTERNQ